MIVIFIIGCLLFLIGVALLANEYYHTAFACGVFGMYIVSGAFLFIIEEQEPSAMDVYQGKTTLKVTYIDGLPVDSVVVFKK